MNAGAGQRRGLGRVPSLLVRSSLARRNGYECLQPGIAGGVRTLYNALHPVYSVTRLGMKARLRLAGRKPLEGADVGVDDSIDMSSALVNRFSGLLYDRRTTMPTMPLELPGCAGRGRRHGVIVSTTVRGRAAGRGHGGGHVTGPGFLFESH